MRKKDHESLTLVGLDIEGDWNIPLLRNAAAINGASLIFANTKKRIVTDEHDLSLSIDVMGVNSIADLRADFDSVLACETGTETNNLFKFPRPRGKTAVVVGNEKTGISKEDLKQTDSVISIPLRKSEMSSLNVAVAAAIALFVLDKELARRGTQTKTLSHFNVDLLINNPTDPNELGSLLRTVWAFGWNRVYLNDPDRIWFSDQRDVVLAGRSAARSEKNPLVVTPAKQIERNSYDIVINCNLSNSGSPLSKFKMPKLRNALLSFGAEGVHQHTREAVNLHVDARDRDTALHFRHAGSIFCAYFAQYLRSAK